MRRWFTALVQSVFSVMLPCVTSADLTTLNELMKEVYDPVIQEQHTSFQLAARLVVILIFLHTSV